MLNGEPERSGHRTATPAVKPSAVQPGDVLNGAAVACGRFGLSPEPNLGASFHGPGPVGVGRAPFGPPLT